MNEVYIVEYCPVESDHERDEIIGVYAQKTTAMLAGLEVAKDRIHKDVTFFCGRCQWSAMGNYVVVYKMEVQP